MDKNSFLNTKKIISKILRDRDFTVEHFSREEVEVFFYIEAQKYGSDETFVHWTDSYIDINLSLIRKIDPINSQEIIVSEIAVFADQKAVAATIVPLVEEKRLKESLFEVEIFIKLFLATNIDAINPTL